MNLAGRQVLVTGGAGYVGAVLVPKLLKEGCRVRVIDWMIYGDGVFGRWSGHSDLEVITGDIRDESLLASAAVDCTDVIHLACISNDPSFELDRELSRSVNFDAFEPLVRVARDAGVERFIYASTSSVYGVSDAPNVTEDHPLVPLTDYNRYKGLCEPILHDAARDDFTTVVIRPATVCGYSPRQRLDLTVNILTHHALNKGVITVFGGEQQRPNIHIDDVTDLYVKLLHEPKERIAGETFNVGYQNRTVRDIASIVRDQVQNSALHPREVEVVTTPSDDIRSYHISSDKIRRVLGFEAKRSIEDAVDDLVIAFEGGDIPDAESDRYYNVRQMKNLCAAGALS